MGILKRERQTLSQLTHARKDEKGLETQERRLLWKLRSLFVKEAAYRQRMTADEHELIKRTVKAKRKLAEMRGLTVRILRTIKQLKIKMAEQISRSKIFQRKRGAILSRERKSELIMNMKIR